MGVSLHRFLIPFCILLFAFCIPSIAQDYTLSKRDTSDIQYLDGKKYYILKVDKSETLYNISKRFNVSQDELIKINPWIKDGLKVNKKVWIPAPFAAAKKTAPKEEVEKEKTPAKPLYNVAVFLPLRYQGINYDLSLSDSAENNTIDRETLSDLEFYEGIQHAVDTLASKECKVHLSLYDTGNDSLTTAMLLKEWRLKDVDFIISQNSFNIQKMVNKYSIEHHLPLFTFSMNGTEVLKDNPYAFSLQPSSNLQCRLGGKYSAGHFKADNAIAIKTSSKENERAISFQKGWEETSKDVKPKIVDYSSLDSNVILKALVKGKVNVVFVASSNEDMVNPLLLTLINHKEDYPVTIVGLPTWQSFESIDMEVLENLNTHIFSAWHHNHSEILNFRTYFRNEYSTEPLDAAFQGFDVMMLIGKNFMGKKQPDKKDYNGIFTSYIFPETKGVHENTFVTMMKYRNYDLVEVR